MSQDVLFQPSLLFQGHSGITHIPLLPDLRIMASPDPIVKRTADAICRTKSQTQAANKQNIKENKSSFGNADKKKIEDTIPSLVASPSQTLQSSYPCGGCKLRPQIKKNLLKNFGFECVMQFNEFDQSGNVNETKPDDTESNIKDMDKEMKVEIEKENKAEEVKMKTEVKTITFDLPVPYKCVCLTCFKEFSSIWVLKAHQEEVHKDIVPTDNVNSLGEKFNSDFAKKQQQKTENTQNGDRLKGGSTCSNTTSRESEYNSKHDIPPLAQPLPKVSPLMMLSQMMPLFGLGMPMTLPFSMSTACNMHRSVMPIMFPVSQDSTVSTQPYPCSRIQKQQDSQLEVHQATTKQFKVGRTRINVEQLKILRTHFDINNSPSEEQIMAMSEQSSLPTKVVKCWFRNTLFKERQRNKDSPYNFNVAPTTTLDLDEYWKTGEIPVVRENAPEKTENKRESIEHEEKIKDNEKHKGVVQMSVRRETESHDLRDNRNNISNITGTCFPFNMMSPDVAERDIQPKLESKMYHISYNKRASRTRFTEYQIKALKEYFEQNAYPKDDALDHLSQLLNLSTRVILVWFQNARQKAKKIHVYKNLPAGPKLKEFPCQSTPGFNFQFQKCPAVYPRVADLIRHKKKQCGFDGDIIQMPLDGDLNAETDTCTFDTPSHEDNIIRKGTTHSHKPSTSGEEGTKNSNYSQCEDCRVLFDRLLQENQIVHSMNPSVSRNVSPRLPFDVRHTMPALKHQGIDKANKKFKEGKDINRNDPTRTKRLRTIIQPEQLNFLYRKYKKDRNPSRKQLENISVRVGLTKRVVQVWFQNTRARERKGKYRAHQQLIHKRCPFCCNFYGVKSAFEWHLANTHPEEMFKGAIGTDILSDSDKESPINHQSLLSNSNMSTGESHKLSSPPSMRWPFMPSAISMEGFNMSMDQIYADSYKTSMPYLGVTQQEVISKAIADDSPPPKNELGSVPKSTVNYQGEAPLDLSKHLKINADHQDISSDEPDTSHQSLYDDHAHSSDSYMYNIN